MCPYTILFFRAFKNARETRRASRAYAAPRGAMCQQTPLLPPPPPPPLVSVEMILGKWNKLEDKLASYNWLGS